jgi:hypothetical protein
MDRCDGKAARGVIDDLREHVQLERQHQHRRAKRYEHLSLLAESRSGDTDMATRIRM